MSVWILGKDVIGVWICFMRKCLRREIFEEGEEDRGIIVEKKMKMMRKMKRIGVLWKLV